MCFTKHRFLSSCFQGTCIQCTMYHVHTCPVSHLPTHLPTHTPTHAHTLTHTHTHTCIFQSINYMHGSCAIWYLVDFPIFTRQRKPPSTAVVHMTGIVSPDAHDQCWPFKTSSVLPDTGISLVPSPRTTITLSDAHCLLDRTVTVDIDTVFRFDICLASL